MGGEVTRREFGLRPCLACCLNAHFLSKLLDAKQTLNFWVRLSFQIVVLAKSWDKILNSRQSSGVEIDNQKNLALCSVCSPASSGLRLCEEC